MFSLRNNLSNTREAAMQTVSALKSENDALKAKDELRLKQIETARQAGETAGRKDALRRSQAVQHGFSSENFAPLLSDHDWSHKDFRHLGDPVDFLVVDGMEAIRKVDSKGKVEVVLLDIKTGKAGLNTIQRRIRDAIVDGRVRFATYNTDTGNLRYWPPKEPSKQLQLPFGESK